jgi:hypothetical protein
LKFDAAVLRAVRVGGIRHKRHRVTIPTRAD